jgi:hypothetical protein
VVDPSHGDPHIGQREIDRPPPKALFLLGPSLE